MAGKTAASRKKSKKAASKAPAGKARAKKTKKVTAKKVASKPASRAAPKSPKKTAPKAVRKAAGKTAAKAGRKKAPAKTARKAARKAVAKTAAKAAGKAAARKPAKPKSSRSKKHTVLPKGYQPSDKEDFMNPMQMEYFRRKLLKWREELLSGASGTLDTLSEENFHKPDMTDRAQMESDASLELRTRDRERKLLSKIESALRRIEDGSYGYCQETDEPISLKRLEARPIASLTLDAQERHERMERVHRDD